MADGVKRLPNAFSIILDEVCSQIRLLVIMQSCHRMLGNPRLRDGGVSEGVLLRLNVETSSQPNRRHYQSLQGGLSGSTVD